MQKATPVKKLDVFSVIVVGRGGVGKSAMILQYLYNEFVEDYEPTKADSYQKQILLDGDDAVLNILDTAGEEIYPSIRENYFRNGDGFLCVFSITDRTSYDSLKEFREQILRVNGDCEAPFIMVGTKFDLNENRQVLKEEAEVMAQEWGAPYIETSAKTNDHIAEVFSKITREMRSRRKSPDLPADENDEKAPINCTVS